MTEHDDDMMFTKEMSPSNDCSTSPLEIDETIVTKKGQSNCINENGKRLLQCAREGDTVAVLELLAKGAPIATDWLGTSPLHLAVINNHYSTSEVLLCAGVGKDARTKVDRTPLHLAVYDGYTNIVKLLLKKGAEVDCRDMLKMTPLHWAVEKSHKECIQVLLSYGANPRAMSRFYKTPLSIAMEKNWDEVVELLQKTRVPETNQNDPPTLPLDTQLKLPLSKFSFDYENEEEDFINMNNEKENSDSEMNEIETESIDTEKDPQAVLESLLPQVEESPSEATLQLLKDHGITLLPTDNTNTVNSAIQSGRKIVLSDAGKLVLNDVALNKKKTNPIEINKQTIFLPQSKMKATSVYALNKNQFIAVPNTSKPTTLPKILTDSPKKLAMESPTVNYVHFQKSPNASPIKLTPWNNNLKIVNAAAVKTIDGTTVVKNNNTFKLVTPKSPPKIPIIKGGMYKLNSNKAKIIKLKRECPVKLVISKNNNTIHSISEPDPASINDVKEVLPLNVMADVSDEEVPSKDDEINRLKSELELAREEVEYYRKKLEETEVELALLKSKNIM